MVILRYAFMGLLVFLFVAPLNHAAGEEKRLQLTPEERAFLQAHPTLRVSNEMDWPPFDFREDGRAMGYSVDYLRLMAGVIGVELEFVGDRAWVELLELFKGKELDILHPICRTREREAFVLFGEKPLMRLKSCIFTRRENSRLRTLEQLDGLTVALGEGWRDTEDIRRHHPKIKVKTYPNMTAMLKAVAFGEVDATIGCLPVFNHLITSEMLTNVVPTGFVVISTAKDEEVFWGVQPERPVLKSILDKAMEALPQDRVMELRRKWFGEESDLPQGARIELTSEEAEFLAAHPVIKVANDYNYRPFDFNEDGQAKGFSNEYVEALAEALGIRVEFVTADWDELSKQFEDGEIDVLTTVSKSEERSKYAVFTEPYLKSVDAFAHRAGEGPYTSYEQLAGKRVASPESFLILEELREQGIEFTHVKVKDIADALKAVAVGKADVVSELMPVLNWYIWDQGLINIEVSARIDREGKYVADLNHLAVRKDLAPLRDLFDKAHKKLENTTILDLKRRWFTAPKERFPSQLALTSEERAFLAKHPVIRVHNEMDWPPLNYNVDGQPRGLTIDIMNRLAEISGFTVEYVHGYTWDELETMLREKRLDVLGNIVPTESRKEYILFTDPYIHMYQGLAVKRGDEGYTNFDDLKGRTIAVERGFFQVGLLREHYPDIKLLELDSSEECLLAVAEGRANAVIGAAPTMDHLIRERFITGLTTVVIVNNPVFESARLAFGVRKDWPELETILSKALAAMGPEELASIKHRWLESSASAIRLRLTPEEEAYLRRRGLIRYCADPEFMPFEGVTGKGKITGMSSDYIQLLSERIGVPFSLVRTTNWTEALDKAQSRECDILTVAASNPKRLEYLNFTKPYLENPIVIATRQDEFFVESIDALAGKKVGMVKGYSFVASFKAGHPGIRFVDVDSIVDGLTSLQKGELDAYIDSVPTIGYYMRKEHISDLKISGRLKSTWDLGIGVRNDDPLLLSVLEKALASISDEERRRIDNKWININVESGMAIRFVRTWALRVGLGVILVFGLILLWNRRMSREINKRRRTEQELRESQTAANILYEVASTLTRSGDLYATLAAIHDILMEHMHVPNFFVGLWDAEKRSLYFPIYRDQYDQLEGHTFENLDLDNPRILSCRVIAQKKPQFLRPSDMAIRESDYTLSRVWLGAPLMVEGEVIGLMVVQEYDAPGKSGTGSVNPFSNMSESVNLLKQQYEAPDRLSEKDADLFVALSESVAAVIQRKRMEESLRSSQALTSTLYAISSTITQTGDLYSVLTAVHHALDERLGVPNFFIALWDEEKRAINYYYHRDEFDTYENSVDRNVDLTDPPNFTARVLAGGAPLLLRGGDILSVTKRGGTDCQVWLGVPLRIDRDIIGVMAVQDYHNEDRFTEKDVDFMVAVSDSVAAVINRKRVEEALATAREELRTLFENLPLGIFQSHLDGYFLSANPRMASLFGFESPAQFLSEVTDVANQLYQRSEDRDCFVNSLKEQGYVDGFELPAKRRDGSAFWCELSARLHYNDAGEVSAIDGFAVDITERKEMHEALVKAREELRTFFENLPVGVFQSHIDGYPLSANPKMASLFGYDSPEHFMREVTDAAGQLYYDPVDREYFINTLRENGSVDGHEMLARRRDDSLFWGSLSARFHYDKAGKAYAVDGFVVDVTERKEMHEALVKARNQLNIFFENLPIGIYQAHTDGYFLRANPAIAQMFGYESSRELIDNVRDIASQIYFHAEDRVQLVDTLHREGVVSGQELLFKRRDGTPFWVSLHCRLHHDADSGAAIIDGHMVDITERKTMHDALIREKERAEEATRAKTEFLARMSHEIRTPMNAILGMSELLAETELNYDQLDYVQTLQSSSEILLSIINDILDFSKIEAGQVELESEPFDLIDLVEGVGRILGVRAREKGLELAYRVAPEVRRYVLGDVTRLKQVLINLVGNAIKFTDTGEVTFSIDPGPLPDDLEILQVTVRDTGIGISRDKQESVFEHFTQADTSTTRKFGGTGLGLAISKRLVELMDGRIWIESEAGQGTTFLFTTRLAPSDRPPASSAFSEEGVTNKLGGVRVLVVDDNSTNRLLLYDHLTRWGAVVDLAENGEAALSEVEKTTYHIIFMDMLMPGMSGLEAAGVIKQKWPEPPPHIVINTSRDVYEDRSLAQDLELDGFLPKPVKRADLSHLLSKVLGKDMAGRDRDAPAPALENLPPLKVLLVEDIPANRKVVHQYLKKSQVEIVDAENGRIAVDLYQESMNAGGGFDLVLMDREMPVMDGMTATAEIRRLEEEGGLRRTPIVALTAHAFGKHKEECLAVGCDDFLAKPVKKRELLQTIVRMTIGSNKEPENQTGAETDMTGSADLDAPMEVRVDVELKDLIPEFLEDLDEELENMDVALDSGDFEKLRLLAHGYKGAAGNYEMMGLFDIFLGLENAARGENRELCREKLLEARSYRSRLRIEYVNK